MTIDNLVSAVLGAAAATAGIVFTGLWGKLLDEHWPNRREIFWRASEASLVPLACVLMGLLGVQLSLDETISRWDVLMSAIVAMFAAVALMLRVTLRLSTTIGKVIDALHSRDELQPAPSQASQPRSR